VKDNHKSIAISNVNIVFAYKSVKSDQSVLKKDLSDNFLLE
jgi:hypothetical protein